MESQQLACLHLAPDVKIISNVLWMMQPWDFLSSKTKINVLGFLPLSIFFFTTNMLPVTDVIRLAGFESYTPRGMLQLSYHSKPCSQRDYSDFLRVTPVFTNVI